MNHLGLLHSARRLHCLINGTAPWRQARYTSKSTALRPLILCIQNTAQPQEGKESRSTSLQAELQGPSARRGAFLRRSTPLCGTPTVVTIFCRQNRVETILHITSTRLWTLLRTFDDISHCKDWPTRNAKHDIFKLCVI